MTKEFVLTVLCSLFVTVGTTFPHDKDLRLGDTLYNQVLYNGQQALYHLRGLGSNSSYEIRVSYPATIPTDFVIRVQDLAKWYVRKTLNIEKALFQTGESYKDYYAEIRAYRTGLPHDSARLQDPIVFNVVVEKLHYGLSLETWKLGLIALLLLLGIWFFMVPWLYRYLATLSKRYHPHKS